VFSDASLCDQMCASLHGTFTKEGRLLTSDEERDRMLACIDESDQREMLTKMADSNVFLGSNIFTKEEQFYFMENYKANKLRPEEIGEF